MNAFDPSKLNALVVDPNHYQRRITLEQLRQMGFGAVEGVAAFAEAETFVRDQRPQIVLIEWQEPRDEALAFVRRIRTGPEPYSRDVSLLMLTARGRLMDVESAREAGVDGYLRKPISALAIQQRVRFAFVRPKGDTTTTRADPNAGRARELAAALERRARAISANNPEGLRALRAAAVALNTCAAEIGDGFLRFGATQLARYIDLCGDQVDPEAVRTHAAALFQISLLPAGLADARERLSRNLKRMVDKKIRQVGAA
jgi:two-component system chemotaxis response regulator CheY